MGEKGHTLIEMVMVLAIIVIFGTLATPYVRAYSAEAHILGAGREFKSEFQKARSIAIRRNVQTAIRFEHQPDGDYYSVYADGNHNGVLAADIRSGQDWRMSGPFRLDGRAPGVRVGINPGVPSIPPETGLLDTSDPIRFSADMVSFSPLGTATPGTFYLAGDTVQGAVRVTGTDTKVRLMVCRGTRWTERY
jgi:prepilin-type N-terminal cleavage/methylation domain-containing protein